MFEGRFGGRTFAHPQHPRQGLIAIQHVVFQHSTHVHKDRGGDHIGQDFMRHGCEAADQFVIPLGGNDEQAEDVDGPLAVQA